MKNSLFILTILVSLLPTAGCSWMAKTLVQNLGDSNNHLDRRKAELTETEKRTRFEENFLRQQDFQETLRNSNASYEPEFGDWRDQLNGGQ